MSSSRVLKSTLFACTSLLFVGCAADAGTASAGDMAVGNPITGEGLPNPAPNVTTNWGDLPDGREWGNTAGIDIDPNDGQVWAYERCGSGQLSGGGTNCDINPVDPIFKFDRSTGAVLANFGAGVMVIPHGIHVDGEGNVWIADFAGNQEGTKGHQVHKFSSDGELLMSLGTAGQPGNDESHFNQPNDVVTGPDGSIYVGDGHSGQGMTTGQAIAAGRESGATGRIMKFSADGEFIIEFTVADPPAGTSAAYLRMIPRTEMDIAIVGSAVRLTVDGDIVTDANVVRGAVAPTAVTVPDAVAALIGATINAGLIDDSVMNTLADAASAACNPIDDKRGTVTYRRQVAGVLTRRAAAVAAGRAQNGA